MKQLLKLGVDVPDRFVDRRAPVHHGPWRRGRAVGQAADLVALVDPEQIWVKGCDRLSRPPCKGGATFDHERIVEQVAFALPLGPENASAHPY